MSWIVTDLAVARLLLLLLPGCGAHFGHCGDGGDVGKDFGMACVVAHLIAMKWVEEEQGTSLFVHSLYKNNL